MLNVKIYVTGTLKEQYYKDAIAEYKKRLNAFCKFEILEFKEYKLPEDPSQKQIEQALKNRKNFTRKRQNSLKNKLFLPRDKKFSPKSVPRHTK